MENIYEVKEINGNENSKMIVLSNHKNSVYYSTRLHPEIINIFNDLQIKKGEKIIIKETEMGLKIKRFESENNSGC